MSRHGVSLLGPGGAVVFEAEMPRSVNGPTGLPRRIMAVMEREYRRYYGITDGGGLSLAGPAPKVTEPSPMRFVTRADVEVSVYRTGADGVLRQDPSSVRPVTLVLTDDWLGTP